MRPISFAQAQIATHATYKAGQIWLKSCDSSRAAARKLCARFIRTVQHPSPLDSVVRAQRILPLVVLQRRAKRDFQLSPLLCGSFDNFPSARPIPLIE